MEVFFDIGIERKKGEALIKNTSEHNDQKVRKGEVKIEEPVKFKITEGKKLYDIVGFQDPINFAISERLYSLLIEHKITGWKGYEVLIGEKKEKYYGFQVTGKCGKLNIPKESGFYTGYKFDYKSWDKSDFFSPQDTMLLFCNKRVQKLLSKYKITNIELTDIDEVKSYSVGW